MFLHWPGYQHRRAIGRPHQITGMQLASTTGLNRSIDLYPPFLDQQLGLAAAHHQVGQFEQAVQLYVVAIDMLQLRHRSLLVWQRAGCGQPGSHHVVNCLEGRITAPL